jgi:precorrin-6B C5,15-methyltransferase / cobalt-precorrin-6B C5,C15-methyltransferase
MITVIGLDGSPLAPEAAAAVARASLVVGGRRHLAAVPPAGGARTVVMGELSPALDALAAHDGAAVVLASGDPGFFGIVRALRSRGLACTVIPAVSSVSLAFARAGLPWDDAMVVSAHGRDPRPALNVCRAYPKVAVLTAPGAGPAEIGAALAGWDRRLIVCEHLGEAGEQITECSPAAAPHRDWSDPNIVLVLAPERREHPTSESAHPRPGSPGWAWPPPPGTGWALPEDEFDCRDAVITKAEVRALALARLAPRPGTLIWDVGAGTGSVGIECARFGAAVIAVERDQQRCAQIMRNAARHGTGIRVIAGEAPDALANLPEPDAVFVGGGGPAVLAAVAKQHPQRIVVALAAVERTGQAHAALTEAGYTVEGSLIQAARFAPLPGDAHRLAGTNPVFLLWAITPPDKEVAP